MVQIEFKVSGQNIVRTDDKRIVRGTKGILECVFDFCKEWKSLDGVVAQFSNNYDFKDEYGCVVKNARCSVPDEVTESDTIYLRLYGKKGTALNVTKRVMIGQEV